MHTIASVAGNNQTITSTYSNSGNTDTNNWTEYRNNVWMPTDWLPSVIDDQLKQIAIYRKRFVKAWEHAGSGIDLDVTFSNADDVILYIPRAAQIAFLSPFPNLWFSEGKKVTGDTMRIVSAFEMVFMYIALLGLPISLWKNRKEPAMWVIVFVSTGLLIVYAMVIPNVGALYRFRYPYIMPLTGLGLAGWFCLQRDLC